MVLLISVIIPTYNRAGQLKDCLDSLFNQTYKNFEIIVIDDGSTDCTEDLVRDLQKEHKNLKYLKQKNKGPAGARNLGIKKARGKIIVFCDDDCTADKEWIKNIAEAYKNTCYNIIGGRTLGSSGNIFARTMQASQDFWLGTIHTEQNLSFWKFLKLVFKPYSNTKSREVNFLPSNNLSFKKNIAYFNESFKDAAVEDLDLAWDLYKKGHKIRYDPKIVVYHCPDLTFHTFLKRYYIYGKNFSKFKEKHRDYNFSVPNNTRNIFKFFIEPFFVPFLLSLHVESVWKIPVFFPIFFSQEIAFRYGFLVSFLKNKQFFLPKIL